MSGVVKHTSTEIKTKLGKNVLEDLLGYENNDVHEEIGKFLAKVFSNCSEEIFAEYIDSLIEKVSGKNS